MTIAEFRATVSEPAPPPVSAALQALWHDARGDWDKAHEVANNAADSNGAWVHAYLHRKEGDMENAGYWYGRASQPVATMSIDEEWALIVAALVEST